MDIASDQPATLLNMIYFMARGVFHGPFFCLTETMQSWRISNLARGCSHHTITVKYGHCHRHMASGASPLTVSMIEIKQACKKFGTIPAVSDLSLSAGKGEVLGFLGPNGAGKTTTMRMATGFLRPDSGRIRICGADIQTEIRQAQSCIGYLPEGTPTYGDMTVRSFLRFIADIRRLGRTASSRLDTVLTQTGLHGVVEQRIDTLSKGYKRRVGLAQAILHNPPVLILDEPTDGLDPNQKHSVHRLISAMAVDKTIIISTHILEEIEDICTRTVIIDRGTIVADCTPQEMLARSRYRNAVTLVVSANAAARIEICLNSLDKVAAVERSPAPGGNIRIIAFARAGALLIETLGAAALREGWPLISLTAETGRMDDVFRALTTHDGDAV